MREIENYTSKFKDILCSWITEITIVKMFILLKTIYRFNVIHIKTPIFLTVMQKTIL